MEKIKTAKNAQYPVCSVSHIQQPDQLYLRITGTPMAEVAAVFADSGHTKKLWYGDQYFAMYTKLIALIPEPGCIRVVLGR